ncbi:3-hydroxyacyl-ACP dehydratase FabZ [Rhodobacteraceae bacterium 2CG4]|uniref:3-hydroxyacyl-[acyl-carrier-protein] dehydratase FabZ n=1 Tax=Halovulum marinum TaxID=2662447 RepID=A0A6L5Z031_9RHOB|nr:3-hydroxyacyl-ACP dehydratase FabZ [Halovulum marinum]MSU89926.1 3-hydroxyacyl-ACP dehydratase FabZ [Halovulum marinum]
MGHTAVDPELGQADIHLIKRLIPHRYPFLYIDRVINMVPSERAVGVKNVTANEPYFAGHFPAKPVLPGVIIIEAMAQSATALVSWSTDLNDSGALVYFMGIDKARFRRVVEPGDQLELHVQVIRKGAKVWKFSGAASVGDEVAAEAEFMAMIQRPEAEG